MHKTLIWSFGLLLLSLSIRLSAEENLLEKPFAQEVWLPEAHQWLVTPWYQYTEFQSIWRGSRHERITVGDGHGFDQNDGAVMVEYGIRTNWAADLHLGYTWLATRAFTPNGSVQQTDGLLDVTFGLRWQVLNETNTDCKFAPTLTLRAGGIYRGTYDHNFPFAPGDGSVGIEPSVLLSKDFGWGGLGFYGNVGYRDIRSGGNNQVFGSAGFYEEHKGLNFNVGYRHQQDLGGIDIGGTGNTIVYSQKVKEVNQLYEVGVGYTDRKHRHYQFYLEQNFSGRNTGDKTVYGINITFPFGP